MTVYRQLADLAAAGEAVATATVIAARGSTPREVGAKMLVRRSGAIVGTVGGGCGEAQVFWEAARALDEDAPRVTEVDLTGDLNDLSQTNCGGVMEVFVDCLRWDRPRPGGVPDAEVVRAVGAAAAARRPVVVVTVTNPAEATGLGAGAKWVLGADGALLGAPPAGLRPLVREAAAAALQAGRSQRLRVREGAGAWERAEDGGVGLFVEVITPSPELLVVGAGHIAQPLVAMGKLLGFHVTVIDDRRAFADRERFPDADEIAVGRIEDLLRDWRIGPATYLVLVTRGHQFDEAALKVVIGADAAYIGMIGSRRRVREVFRHLAAAGVPEERIARVHAPIGLAIGAESPAEIAVAIAAELVQVRRARAEAANLSAAL
jgi:xanthine dehydrogenase accessory factor